MWEWKSFVDMMQFKNYSVIRNSSGSKVKLVFSGVYIFGRS